MSHTHARATASQVDNRARMQQLFEGTPLPTDELLVNLQMYQRSSVLAKMLWVNEIYELMVRVPGIIVEFGVWWGANLALFENLRAVYEPYNYTRRIVGFDTFEGHSQPTSTDGEHDHASSNDYRIGGEAYVAHLRAVLACHQAENVMGHLDHVEVVPGDATRTFETYLERHPETLVSLAYFDMQMYEPTKRCLELVLPRMPRGAILAMDELNCVEYPGETTAFLETVGLDRCTVVRSRFLPDRSYVILD